jgi:predicted AlkP superfamily pyrophosphatase or phosphodiesterase
VSAGEHGLLGYQVRDPDSGEIVNHLKPFPRGVDPQLWQPQPTLFEQAQRHSIPSIAVGESRFSGTDFSRSILRGAEFHGSSQLDSHLEILREFFDSSDEAIAYLYWPALDRIGHQLGVQHENWVDALENLDHVASALESMLGPGEAMVITADHGMVDVEREHQVWWPSNHPLRSSIRQWAGEPRLVQLYLQPDVEVDEFARLAQEFVAERATVLRRSEIISRELFGKVAPAHESRIGDVVVFSEGPHAVYDELSATETSAKMVGQHGSWTPTEVSVPVIPLGGGF